MRHLETTGVTVAPYQGGPLPAAQVLVVGAGGGPVAAANAGAVADFLKAGGALVALGLDEAEANSFLPANVTMSRQEHIATVFEPFRPDSPFAGVGPADVHNRDPRELPLVTGSASVVGDGVLAQAESANIVFYQLPPYDVEPARATTPVRSGSEEPQNLRRTYRRASFVLTRLLANLGVRGDTPLLSRFAKPAGDNGMESVLKNGDLQADADGDGMPDQWQVITDLKPTAYVLENAPSDAGTLRCLRLTSPGAGAGGKGSVLLAQHDVALEKGQWYRLALRARAEGLGSDRVSITVQNTMTWQSIFDYQRFAPSDEWKEFAFLVQAKATAPTRTRFQIWHASAGTLWLADIRLTPCDPPTQGRWSSGLYVDQVQEWDDPYRFFRW